MNNLVHIIFSYISDRDISENGIVGQKGIHNQVDWENTNLDRGGT